MSDNKSNLKLAVVCSSNMNRSMEAHAFLSTGNLITESKKAGISLHPTPMPLAIISVVAAFCCLLMGAYSYSGSYLALGAYFGIMLLSLSQNIGKFPNSLSKPKLMGAITLIMLAALVCYGYLEGSLSRFLGGTVPSLEETSHLTQQNLPVIAIALLLFALGYLASMKLARPQSDFWKRVYIHLWNGGYGEARSSRLLAGLFPVR